MKASLAVATAILCADARPAQQASHWERCQIVDVIMDGRTPTDLAKGRRAYKNIECVSANSLAGQFYRVRVLDSRARANRARPSLVLAPGERCSEGYEGVDAPSEPGIYSYVEIELRATDQSNEIAYSAGLRIQQIDAKKGVNEMGLACGGSNEGVLRRTGKRWLQIDKSSD